jgi:DNA-binding response OmpR family regulator
MITSLPEEKKPKLLIVDDDPNEMNSLAIGLRLEGFDAEGIDNGTKALAMMEETSYAAVLIDLMMPEMNGLQLARHIRASFPQTMTIMMSAYHLSPIQLAKADTGVVGFVPKPYCFDDLVHFIKQKLDPTDLVPIASDTSGADSGFSTPIDIPSIVTDSEPDHLKPIT